MTALDDEIGPRDLQRFVTVLRGYDRIEVDECLLRIAATVAALRNELDTERRARQEAERRAPAAADPARSDPPDGGFGVRAERLLRLAEDEAREMRANASREGAALVEQARGEAERLRHEREQELIARSSALEQETAKRSADLQQRESRLAEQLGEIRREADSVRVAARRDVDTLRERAQAEIAGMRSSAEAEVARQREQAAADVERFRELETRSRSELQRLVDLLVGGLQQGSSHPDGDTAAGPAGAGREAPRGSGDAARRGDDFTPP